MEKLVIIQHNVLKWTFNRSRELTAYYKKIDPDILLDATGIVHDTPLKIYGYSVYKRNIHNEDRAGIAVAIKKNLEYKLLDDFVEDVLAVEVRTRRGPLVIGTTYLPPRRRLFPREDIKKILQRRQPSYLFGDLNASHGQMGFDRNNANGDQVHDLINRGIASHLGHDFPTFVGINLGRPDILLANRQAHLNYALQQGALTSSNHLPVILTLATESIVIPTAPRNCPTNADWENEQPEVKDKTYIDNKLKDWFDTIARAVKDNIPIIGYRILKSPENSNQLKLLQWQFENLERASRLNRWSGETFHRAKRLQTLITEESKVLHDQHWERIVKSANDLYGHPAKFWENISRLLGKEGDSAPYITDNNRKIYQDNEKELVFREYCQNIFRITD
ncbi:uncharacterized protein LOC135197200 [Macrobrachium nipponense]|uniref:uncharacterized protein LOC135197200 n=1 Tax=Macrobrachium nipponense TaxID=159736 RepID=UPI0030C7E6AD